MAEEVDPAEVTVQNAVLDPPPIDPLKPHARPDDLDPKVNGPFLDDIRREQARAVFETRNVLAEKESKSDG
jgi:hypothetical protein